MKNICFLLITSIFFVACSSKPYVNINEKINSISLYEEVVIGNVPRTVQSPVSVGLGIGGFVSNSVSVGVGTSFHPEFSNDEALVLERSFAANNLSLASLIKNEFKSQLMNDGFYKDKFVPFGSDFVIHVFVPKYSVETVIFSPKAQIKMFIEIRILNKFNEIVYARLMRWAKLRSSKPLANFSNSFSVSFAFSVSPACTCANKVEINSVK